MDVVFRILRQHFDSAVYSGRPLAEFDSPLLYVSEHTLDYWIRLNRAAEVAEQVNESRSVWLQIVEVAAMFIRHCPNRDLSLMFL